MNKMVEHLLAEIKANQEEMKACHEATVACLGKTEATIKASQ
jgi:hypothetical protein